MLRELSRIQMEASSESRRVLLNAVTDLFLLDDEPSEASKAHYSEIATVALGHIDGSDRKAYAEKVAAAATLPHTVAVKLAGDAEADVARLVLKLSPVLTDADLAAIAVSQSQGHLVAIAERARLSSSITDILVQRGDQTVLQTVSDNEGAAFSDAGFDKLLERGGNDPVIGAALAARSDLAPARAARVLRIMENMGGSANPGDDGSEHIVNLARQARQQRLEVKLLISDINAKTREIDDVVVMLAEEDRAFHLAQVMGHATSLNVDHLLRVMMQHDVSGIAVVCRSLNLRKFAFKAILALRMRRLPRIDHEVEETLLDYARLDAATADRALRFLKLKTAVA